jgi:hypothetical protein
MEKIIYLCENCGKSVNSEKELRRDNWLQIRGDSTHGIGVWLEKPRKHKDGVPDSYMLTIGWQDREYHFCSIKCLVKLLKGKESK